MNKKTLGLLVMAYGTPASLDQVEAYYTHIRRGNPPTPEKLQELVERYEAIGGVSPLNEITQSQVSELEKKLNQLSEEYTFKAYIGMKHAHPFIDEAVAQMADDGITEAVGIVLAPHYSVMSVGTYNKTAMEAALKHQIKLTCVKSYHLEPKFIDALVQRVEASLSRFETDVQKDVNVLFTAHSLPEKILEMGDPYPEQLRETAQVVAEKAGVANWDNGWQSAGQTAVPWLGPDLLDQMQTLRDTGVTNLIVSPIGFVSDHLEVLYDIDIEAQKLAEELGIHLERTSSLNADPLFIEALSHAVMKELTK
ncbi:ferrochelatase [Ammoniphilus sp. CFH 90114]|uniref:ferrochelatase n=1 Tax=Ammoniphilus sp. CFH 90114 TaxID=2493665 RepID=UPI00100F107A|nr:ferrochelatase [Ammoniphilus sp. CFH 90114]RXT04197.1 ferrochelatase [Ammoniphilus sp. CFH 90114]